MYCAVLCCAKGFLWCLSLSLSHSVTFCLFALCFFSECVRCHFMLVPFLSPTFVSPDLTNDLTHTHTHIPSHPFFHFPKREIHFSINSSLSRSLAVFFCSLLLLSLLGRHYYWQQFSFHIRFLFMNKETELRPAEGKKIQRDFFVRLFSWLVVFFRLPFVQLFCFVSVTACCATALSAHSRS